MSLAAADVPLFDLADLLPAPTATPVVRPRREWEVAIWGPKQSDAPGCRPTLLILDLRCDVRPHRSNCLCVGDRLDRMVCSCGWEGDPQASENAAVEAWCTHAWPRWRDLPILTSPFPDDAKKRDAWLRDALAAGYFAEHLEAGGPVRTARASYGGRHVPGRTPWGGYDLAAMVEGGREVPYEVALLIDAARREKSSRRRRAGAA